MKKIFVASIYIFALSVAEAQNIGIGTTFPKAILHVADSSVVFTAESADVPPIPGGPPVSTSGRRMMWYADKASFRVGAVTNNSSWSKDSIGVYSFGGGRNGMAKGNYSFAYGDGAIATGNYAVSMGHANLVRGMAAVGLGWSNAASGSSSVSIGSQNSSFGEYAVTLGRSNQAAGENAFALGSYCSSSGEGAVAIGRNAHARGDYSFAANRNTIAFSAYEAVFGQYNTLYSPGSSADFINTDRLFVIGNGRSSNERSNALTVFKSGNVGIMTAQPNARLSVSGDASKTGGGVWAAWSDARLKKNITPYTSGLKEILQINPIRFQYNELSGEEDLNKNYVGILAQEIENILPSTITIKADEQLKDKRMFDGSELIYTLINAIKEQQVLINELQQENKTVLEKLNSIKINQTER
ncbi:MAG TPA: tail fiber domain-containing protein [Ferruginibacter sp.]|nr:tail fiber domain-containing protein [Ferruginibacter sp.]